MKKMISLIVLVVMMALPIKANAEGIAFDFNCGNDDKTLKVTWESGKENLVGAGVCTLRLKIPTGQSLDSLKVTFTPFDANIVSLQAATGVGTWTATPDNKTTGTREINLRASAAVAGTGSWIDIAKITVNVKKAKITDNCNFTLTPSEGSKVEIVEKNVCKVVNGKYYGKNGTIVTEAQYNAECAGNPQTGSFVPYALIFSGIGLAVVVFVVSRKNNKMYKL